MCFFFSASFKKHMKDSLGDASVDRFVSLVINVYVMATSFSAAITQCVAVLASS